MNFIIINENIEIELFKNEKYYDKKHKIGEFIISNKQITSKCFQILYY